MIVKSTLFAAGYGFNGMRVGGINRDAAGQAADSRISRGADDVCDAPFGRQLPHQGVFAPAVSDDQDLLEATSRGKLLDIKGLI